MASRDYSAYIPMIVSYCSERFSSRITEMYSARINFMCEKFHIDHWIVTIIFWLECFHHGVSINTIKNYPSVWQVCLDFLFLLTSPRRLGRDFLVDLFTSFLSQHPPILSQHHFSFSKDFDTLFYALL